MSDEELSTYEVRYTHKDQRGEHESGTQRFVAKTVFFAGLMFDNWFQHEFGHGYTVTSRMVIPIKNTDLLL